MSTENGIVWDDQPQGIVWDQQPVSAPGIVWDDEGAQAPSFLGALGTRLKNFVPGTVGGMAEAVGDIMSPDATVSQTPFMDAMKGAVGLQGIWLNYLQGQVDTLRRQATNKLFPEGSIVWNTGKKVAEWGGELGDKVRVENEQATPKDMNIFQEAGLSALESATQIAPWLIAGRLGAPLGIVQKGALTQFGASSFAQTYNDAKASGKDASSAFEVALINGAAEVGGEKLALDTLLKKGSGWFKKFVAQEIGGEEFTTITQSLAEKGSYNPEKWSSGDEIVHDLAVTALAAAGGAGTLGGVSKGMDLIQRNRAEQNFENSTAGKELERILGEAQSGVLATEQETITLPESAPTPAEMIQAEVEREQRKGGIKVEPTQEGRLFGSYLDGLVGSNQKEGRTVAGEPEQQDEGGVTPYVEAGREQRYSPNELPPSQRPIRFSTDENVIGLTLEQAGDPPPGTVSAFGGNEDLFPTPVFSRLVADLGEWVQKYLPEGRILLNLEQFAPEFQSSAFGLYQKGISKNGLLHVITPRDLPGFKYQGGDYKTAFALLGGLSHEFGHALQVQTFYQGISASLGQSVAMRVLDEVRTGRVSDGVLAALRDSAPEEAGVIDTWQTLRAGVLDGTLTAKEFVEAWVGIRKLGQDNARELGGNKSVYTWAKDRLDKVGLTLEGATAFELLAAPLTQQKADATQIQAYLDEYLGLDEYMAEQFSRAAYTRGDLDSSKFGQLFHNALERLRNLFRDLKAQKVIQPGETFQAWLEKQTRRAKESWAKGGARKFELSPEIRKAQEEIAKRASEKLEMSEELREELAGEPDAPEQVPVPEEVEGTEVPTRERLEEVLEEMYHAGEFYGNEPRYRALRGYISRGQYEVARDKIEEVSLDIVKWDREYSSKVLERLPNKEKVKAETLKATLRMQDIKQAEKLYWEQFLAEHPNGFTLEEAQAGLQAAVLPLEGKAVKTYASFGADYVGLGPLDVAGVEYFTRVWQAPFETNPDNHFGEPRYLAHTRVVDGKTRRVILEIQSDYFSQLREGGEELSGFKKNDWFERIIREEILEAQIDGKTELFFPTNETVAAVEGWDQLGEEERAPMRGIQQFYKDAVEKYLKQKFQAQPVHLRGHGYLRVSPQAALGANFAWDKDNPLQPPHPEITLDSFAGMAPADYRKPEIVAQASDMWNRLRFESPFWKRWGGETKVIDETGKPQRVWRGSGSRITFLDKTSRGKQTGAASGAKAFWFTDNKANAGFYAEGAVNWRKNVLNPEKRREAQSLRSKIDEAKKVRLEAMKRKDEKAKEILQRRIDMLSRQLSAFEGEHSVPASPVIQGFYLNMVNPFVADLKGEVYNDQYWTEILDFALEHGHDGVILKNAFDPMGGTHFAIFEPTQAKLESNIGTFDKTDELHWDADSPGQQAVRGVSKLMQNFWERGKLKGMNTAAKVVDNLMQLQQVAASQPDDIPLNSFLPLSQYATKMKNNLQVDAEELTKDMLGIRGASPETVNKLFKVLQEEWRENTLAASLVGKDAQGNVVWGLDQPVDYAARQLVRTWEVVDGVPLRQWLEKHGVQVESEEGKKILEYYIRVRNVILKQFTGLERTLQLKADTLYEGSPTLLKAEKWKIDELMGKLRSSPFLPQGNFGNYVLIIQKDLGPQGRGKRRFQTVRKVHFESKDEWQVAYKQAQALARNDKGIRVKSMELKDDPLVPMQLPVDFLENLGHTGEFTNEQLDLMSELMVKGKFERIEARYAKIGERVEGANADFIRTFSDFALRNSNFIWKMYYKTALRGAISQAKAQARQIEKRVDISPEEQLDLVTRQRRNVGLMERAFDYMIYPPAEYQQARLWITLAYLAFNVKTAVMNLSTQMNTWAAVTSEYGELAGHKIWAQSLYDAASYFWIDKRIAQTKDSKEVNRLNELKNLYARAQADGVIDQSYAYFLAGQANSHGLLGSVKNSWMGRVGHVAAETGMLPFRAMEQANRLSSLVVWYQAERSRGATGEQAYTFAVNQTNLLQNAYDAANKPQLLRGKKAILFMFASYTQFMGWIMMGGYERGMRAKARAEGRRPAAIWHGPTMKLWLLYLALGGVGGLPFAENVMDFVQFAWRKLFGKTSNLEIELRTLVKDMGGDPNMVMQGLMHNAGGFNLSGSFGLGRMLPGTDLLNRNWSKPEEIIGNLGVKFSGPAGGFYMDMVKALGQFGRGNLREGMKELPGAVGAVAKAADAYILQEDNPTYGVMTKTGVRLTWDAKKEEFRDLTTGELVGMALGAQPTLVSQNRDEFYTTQGEVIYWQTRRGDLLDRYWQAHKTGDEELREDVLAEIDRYNEGVPDTKLRVTGKDRALSIKTRRRANRLAETQGTSQKRYRGVADYTEGGY